VGTWAALHLGITLVSSQTWQKGKKPIFDWVRHASIGFYQNAPIFEPRVLQWAVVLDRIF